MIKLLLFDLAKGTVVRKFFKFYRGTLKWTTREIKQYQFKKLKELVKVAYENVPYYQRIFEENNLNPDSIKSLDDMKLIPPLQRNDIANNLENLLNENLKPKKIFKSSSSGTTGIPIIYYHDAEAESAGIAAGYFAYTLSGWKIGSKSVHIWGNVASIENWNSFGSKLKRVIFRQKNIPSTDFNFTDNYEDLVKRILSYRPVSIDGYTSAIYQLAQYLEKNNQKIDSKFVFTTAENLLSYQQEKIEKYIGPVSDLYGCGEITGIAIKPINKDKYYVIDPHVIVEADEKKSNNGNEIIVTDLDNQYLPLIRYKIGDLIDNIFEGSDEDEIKFSYFRKIYGRVNDVIELPNGRKILPINLVGGTLFRMIGGIVKHKVLWDGRTLTFLFETDNSFNYDNAKEIIAKELEKYNINIKVEIVDKISPSESGKFTYFEIV